MSERYSFSLTTFSPSGKLVQIEYALHAVQGGATSIGIKGMTKVVYGPSISVVIKKNADFSPITRVIIARSLT